MVHDGPYLVDDESDSSEGRALRGDRGGVDPKGEVTLRLIGVPIQLRDPGLG